MKLANLLAASLLAESGQDHDWMEPNPRGGDDDPKGFYRRFGVPHEVQNRYSYGECTYLALAMHERYGWPIMAQFNTSNPNEPWIGHAYCVMPDGREVDILGPQTKVDEFEGTIRKVEPKWLRDHMQNTPYARENPEECRRYFEQSMAAARRAVARFITPKVEQDR